MNSEISRTNLIRVKLLNLISNQSSMPDIKGAEKCNGQEREPIKYYK
jgi:hypothetical protein